MSRPTIPNSPVTFPQEVSGPENAAFGIQQGIHVHSDSNLRRHRPGGLPCSKSETVFAAPPKDPSSLPTPRNQKVNLEQYKKNQTLWKGLCGELERNISHFPLLKGDTKEQSRGDLRETSEEGPLSSAGKENRMNPHFAYGFIWLAYWKGKRMLMGSRRP